MGDCRCTTCTRPTILEVRRCPRISGWMSQDVRSSQPGDMLPIVGCLWISRRLWSSNGATEGHPWIYSTVVNQTLPGYLVTDEIWTSKVGGRVRTNPDEYHAHTRELSGPRPLRRVTNIDSKPRIWNRGAGTILFESQPTAQIMGGGKDRNPAYLRPTECQHHPCATAFGFIELRCVKGRRY